MIRTVVQSNYYVDYIAAGQDAGEHSSLDTLINRRDIFLRNRAADIWVLLGFIALTAGIIALGRLGI